MAYTFTELKHKKATELREIAKDIDHDAVHGYSTMHKDHLIEAICKALDIELHEHHEVVGIDKGKIKSKIRELKNNRDKAIEAKDHKKLKTVRKEIKSLKNQLRRATV